VNGARASTLTIRTPEGIDFSLLLASPVTRFLAWVVDFFLVSSVSSVVASLLMLVGLISMDIGMAVRVLVLFAIQIGYWLGCEWFWRGQTFGKRLLRLRVVDANGLRLQFSQVVIRNLLRFVDALPAFYLIGGVTTLLNARTQRLGDLAANTVVIRSPQIESPDLEQILAGKFNSLRQHPHLESRLRQKISPVEAGLALQSLLRRDEFEPLPRAELFARLGEHFRSLVEFPPDTTEGITDEQYIRNVVDTLFRPRGAVGRN
jgi:uncharacterized RDD family membrane protein YckC